MPWFFIVALSIQIWPYSSTPNKCKNLFEYPANQWKNAVHTAHGQHQSAVTSFAMGWLLTLYDEVEHYILCTVYYYEQIPIVVYISWVVGKHGIKSTSWSKWVKIERKS